MQGGRYWKVALGGRPIYFLPPMKIDELKPLPSSFKFLFKKEVIKGYYITDTAQAIKAFKKLTGSGFIACDTETQRLQEYSKIEKAALNPHLATIRLITMFNGKAAFAFDMNFISIKKLMPYVRKFFEKTHVCFHNAVFDFKMLNKWYGCEDFKQMDCSMIMYTNICQALYPFRKKATLEAISAELLNFRMNKDGGKTDWSLPLTFEQVVYALKDAVAGFKLYKILAEYIEKLNLGLVYRLHRAAQFPLAEMELNGIGFDKRAHQENVAKWRVELSKASSDVMAMTGLPIITSPKMGKYLEENLPNDLLQIWPRTPKKKEIKVDAHTLADFDMVEVVKPFAEFQLLKSITTKAGTNIVKTLNPETKRIHSRYNIGGAATGRLSCASPNLQQSPRKPEYRECFIPAPGYQFVAADYSQIEVRIMAEYSQDKKLLKVYEQGLDVYKFSAASVLGIPYKKVTDDQRKGQKPVILGRQFGLGLPKFAHYAKKEYGITLSPKEARHLYFGYNRLYPQVIEWQNRQVKNCERNKLRCRTKLGKVRKLAQGKHYGASMNMPIQGTAAEINLLALVKIRNAIRKYKIPKNAIRIVATIHDENILEALPQYAKLAAWILVTCMTSAYKQVMGKGIRTLRGLVEPSIGKSWQDTKRKENKVSVNKDFTVKEIFAIAA